ncbi:MAG: antibiotic biosynthesis monooxygenase [Candidatus Latescibacteria bacterium]|nr:antibiotic biosynthesis monooxygenase [Candidatus Latescibacterota bacterium]
MPYGLFIATVEDYKKWKPFFDKHAATRKAKGSKGGYVFRSADDPNQVVVLLEWDTLQKMRQFSQSEDLRERMKESGVIGQPDIHFLKVAGKPSA